MSGFTHTIDNFINIMMGLCIGMGLVTILVLLVWVTMSALVSLLKMSGLITTAVDPKYVYPPYVPSKHNSTEREEGRHGTG